MVLMHLSPNFKRIPELRVFENRALRRISAPKRKRQ
jgi:hypothetical protein